MILLTGAAGYIGSHIAFLLNKKKIPFIGIDNFSTNNRFNKMHSIIKRIDIGNKKKIKLLIKKKKITHIIHSAAYSYPVESENKKIKYKNNNYKKTLDFINCFKGSKIKSFIFLSSSNVYNDKKNSQLKETDKTNSKNNYGRYKFLIEKYLKNNRYFDKVIIFRLFNVVGYFDDLKYKLHNSTNQRLITKLLYSIYQKKTLKLNYYKINGKLYSPKRDFIDIKYVVKAILLTIKRKNIFKKYNIFNLGSGKAISLEDLIFHIEKIKKKKIKLKRALINSKELFNTWSSKNKIEKKLSIKIRSSLNNIIISSIKNFNLNV